MICLSRCRRCGVASIPSFSAPRSGPTISSPLSSLQALPIGYRVGGSQALCLSISTTTAATVGKERTSTTKISTGRVRRLRNKHGQNALVIGGLALAYLAMVAEFGYVVALVQSGLARRLSEPRVGLVEPAAPCAGNRGKDILSKHPRDRPSWHVAPIV